jgi:hypothetical protein
MKRLRIVWLTLLAVLVVSAALAADVSGKWVAQVPGRNGQTREVVFNLKADGAQLTGSVVTPRGERQISEGKISGDEISFADVLEFNGNQMKLLYKGKVAGDEIKFTRQREGDEGAQEFTARRTP